MLVTDLAFYSAFIHENKATPMRYSSNLRSRIALFVLLPGVACSLLIGIYLTYAMVRDIASYESGMGNAYSEQIAAQAYVPLKTGDRDALQRIAQLALEYPLLRAITFHDADQQEIIHAGPRHSVSDIPDKSPFTCVTVELASENARQLFVPIMDTKLASTVTSANRPNSHDAPKAGTAIIGWVRIEFSRSFLMLHKYRTILFDILAVAVVLAIAFWLAIPFGDRLSDTLRQMSRSARSIGQGKERIALPDSKIAELQELGKAIGEMQDAMTEQQSNLHHQIEQSTQDLRETLETIEIQNIELDLARREAVQASRIKSEFLANTSHEIRTPLNSIIGFSKLLLKTALSNQQQDYLQNIRKSSENLLTIINDVLDLSKIEAGKLVLDYVSFDINETLEEILQILAPGAHEKGLELLHMIYSDVPRRLLGDPLRLKQVLTNLIGNAIKFSDDGNVVVRIAAENTDSQQTLLKIEVSDTGKGLPNNNQMIFNAFTQLDSSSTREYPGTGLGLAISRKIVEQMGGEIGYYSEPGNTTFWFTVRFDTGPQEQDSQEKTLLQGRHILVYDNERLCRLAISHSLTNWGVQPVLTDAVEQIIPAVERDAGSEQAIEAIILGLPARHTTEQMEQLLQFVQQLRNSVQCPLLLCTPATIRQGLAPLLDTAITPMSKPVTEKRLLEALCNALHLSAPCAESNAVATREAGHYSISVLAVDDTPSNLKLISTMLQDLGADVLEANNGEEAVELFRNHDNIDLILMDIQMPVMDGIEATRKIRQLETRRGSHTPIIALTAHALAEQRQHLLMSGLDDYLSKPASEQQLQQVIEKWHKPQHLPINAIKRSASPHYTSQHQTKNHTKNHSIDRHIALQTCGNRPEIAIEMLEILLRTLAVDRQDILAAISNEDMAQAEALIHKLHGACCYCGVTDLKNYCNAMETLIKKQMTEHLPDVLPRFNEAVDALLHWQEHHSVREFFLSDTSAN